MNTSIKTSLYESLAQTLRADIHDGHYEAGRMIASEHDLARQHQVSRVTVRRATDQLIAEGLVERRPGKGLFVADESKPISANGIIQFVAGNLAWAPCVQAARAVQTSARTSGLQVQIYDAHGSFEEDLALIAALPQSGARGAVIMGLHAPAFAEVLYDLKRADFPFVLVDQQLRDVAVPSVMADNYQGGIQVGQAICGYGHTRIAFIGDLAADTVQARLNGLRDAIGDKGLPFDRRLVYNLDVQDPLASWTPAVRAATRAFMQEKDAPTAIFASCDAIARDVMATLAELHISVGAQVSVVGFDDDPLAAQLQPGLATVRQDWEAMGDHAWALLKSCMASSQAKVENVLLPVQFIERSSLRPRQG